MASAVDIANLALAHLGADAVVVALSPPDGSVESGHCARFLPIARRAALADYDWSFARKRVDLAELVNDSSDWLYKYQLPADCLRPRRVMATATLGFPDKAGADYDVEGDALYTNQSTAALLYTRDVTDTTKYPADFVTGLAMVIAGYLAGPIIKGTEGIKIGDAWMQRGTAALRQATVSDANASMDTTNVVLRSGAHPMVTGEPGTRSAAILDGILDNIANAVWNKTLP
jgi:hypothetical protein